MPLPSRPPLPCRPRGVTLVEALVALLVMSFGMLALAGLTRHLHLAAEQAQQRSEALRIARAELAQLRSAAALGETPVPRDAVSVTPAHAHTHYTVAHSITPLPTAGAGLAVQVTVTWADRAGAPQRLLLDTLLTPVDPVFRAAVALGPPRGAVTSPAGRSPLLPDDATLLDPQRSAYRPSLTHSTVWVFNHRSGIVESLCTLPPGTAVSALVTREAAACQHIVGHRISGSVRFSLARPAPPQNPEAPALPVGLDFVGGSYEWPQLDRDGSPLRDREGALLTDRFIATPPVPASSATGSQPRFECFTDAPERPSGAQTVVRYECIVYQASGPLSWSGKLVLTGLRLGTSAADQRVCRYSADYNGSGDPYTADRQALDNTEHPEVYGRVAGSLIGQNFLVVRGDVDCPRAPAVDLGAGIYADYTTLPLQP